MNYNWSANLPEFIKGERLSANKLNRLVQAIAQLLRARYGFGVATPVDICGKLDGDLVAATTFESSPSTAVLSVWIKNASGNMEDSGRNEDVVCRLENISTITTGTVCYAKWVEGEWVVYIADC